jgi:hypothetical protein
MIEAFVDLVVDVWSRNYRDNPISRVSIIPEIQDENKYLVRTQALQI